MEKKRKVVYAKFRERGETAPAIPAIPAKGLSAVLPSWMYGDPADVAERVEQAALARVEREKKRKYGLLGASTVRLIKQLRIRELVAKAMMKGGAR